MTHPRTFVEQIAERSDERASCAIQKLSADLRALIPELEAEKAKKDAETAAPAESLLQRARRLVCAPEHSRPCLPDLPEIAVPAAVIDHESAEAARESILVIEEHSKLLRSFLREGAEYRRRTGSRVPTREWDAAHDKLHDLARLRERIQERLGRYRRDRREMERSSFERAFVDICKRELDVDRFAEIASEAQRVSRGGA